MKAPLFKRSGLGGHYSGTGIYTSAYESDNYRNLRLPKRKFGCKLPHTKDEWEELSGPVITYNLNDKQE